MRSPAIKPPASPFWEVFRTFGRDELTGGVVALIATAIIEGSFRLYNGGLFTEAATFTAAQMLFLALTGPIIEKVGFFFWHFKEARDTYHTTPVIYRQPFGHYIRQALKGGGKTLFWDILLHDPMYVGLMLVGMHIHPNTPAWLLVPIAFGLAVVAVALLEVAINEIRYWQFTHHLANRPLEFELERYLDARFYLDAVNPDDVITKLRNRFFPDLEIQTRYYEDYYYPVEMPEYNGREGRLRVRCRDTASSPPQGGRDKTISVQYIYSRTVENGYNPAASYRCFPRKKDKHYRMFSVSRREGALEDALNFAENEAKDFNCRQPPIKIAFQRRMVYQPETLFLAVDTIETADRGTIHVIEVKVYPGKEALLVEAMHFVMHHFPAMQTTHQKIDLMG